MSCMVWRLGSNQGRVAPHIARRCAGAPSDAIQGSSSSFQPRQGSLGINVPHELPGVALSNLLLTKFLGLLSPS